MLATESFNLHFFPHVEMTDGVYDALMGMCLCWYHVQFPTQYTLPVALSYRAKAISALRPRLSLGRVDESILMAVLCLLQTDVSFDFQEALYVSFQLTKSGASRESSGD